MNIEQARVLHQKEYSGGYRALEMEAPSIASSIKPGQFVHLRVPRLDGAVLRRPFSVFRASGRKLSILYKVVGRGTEAMTRMSPGDEVSLMGSLGNGFPCDRTDRLPVIVGGGYGVGPLCFLAERMPAKGIVFVGGSTANDVLCVDDFKTLGWDVRIATEDGSMGEKGMVTAVLDAWLDGLKAGAESQERSDRRAGDAPLPPEFYACGPDGLLKAVGERAIASGDKAWLSLDRHMGCGVGACLTCVQRIRKDNGTETWARVCRDGPVFESRKIVWE